MEDKENTEVIEHSKIVKRNAYNVNNIYKEGVKDNLLVGILMQTLC